MATSPLSPAGFLRPKRNRAGMRSAHLWRCSSSDDGRAAFLFIMAGIPTHRDVVITQYKQRLISQFCIFEPGFFSGVIRSIQYYNGPLRCWLSHSCKFSNVSGVSISLLTPFAFNICSRQITRLRSLAALALASSLSPITCLCSLSALWPVPGVT